MEIFFLNPMLLSIGSDAKNDILFSLTAFRFSMFNYLINITVHKMCSQYCVFILLFHLRYFLCIPCDFVSY